MRWGRVNQGDVGLASPCFTAADFSVLGCKLQCCRDGTEILCRIPRQHAWLLSLGFGRVCSFHGFLSIRALFTAFTAAQLTVDMSQEDFFFVVEQKLHVL